jgi:hypothetical protein
MHSMLVSDNHFKESRVHLKPIGLCRAYYEQRLYRRLGAPYRHMSVEIQEHDGCFGDDARFTGSA